MFEREFHHELVEGDDELQGDDGYLAVVGEEEEEEPRVHRLGDDRRHDAARVQTRARARVHHRHVPLRRLHRLPHHRVEHESHQQLQLKRVAVVVADGQVPQREDVGDARHAVVDEPPRHRGHVPRLARRQARDPPT